MASDAFPTRGELTLGDLERSLRRPRTLFSLVLTVLVTMLTIVAAVPLFSVVYMLIVRGGSRLTLESLTSLPPVLGEIGGGIGNCIVGTLLIVAIASLLSVPFGILAAFYLAEIAPSSRVSSAVRFCAKVLTGFPSVLAGVFTYGAIVFTTKTGSAVAGGVALAVLMLPIIMLTAEQAIRMVPSRMREAAVGMGATSWQTAWRVLLPTAMPGILTGVMLAIARAAGETAPLLFTAYFTWVKWPIEVSLNPPSADVNLMDNTPSLAVGIYNLAMTFDRNQQQLAWTAALVLVTLVLGANILGQSLSKRQIHQ